MIVKAVLYIILGVVAVSIVQIAYNSMVYRQINKLKWVKFSLVVVVVFVSSFLLFKFVNPLTDFRYISNVVNVIDSVFFTFIGFLPKNFLIIWFIVPVVLTWIVYLFITLMAVIKNRYKYRKWKKKTELAEQESNNQVAETVATTSSEDTEKENVHFLSEPMTKIRYTSALGLQRAYEISKQKGLQLAESDTGYIAVYADKSGVTKLRELMIDNGIDYSNLKNRPSIVFFDSNATECISIKEALEKMKGGESIV